MPRLDELGAGMPVNVGPDGLHVKDASGFFGSLRRSAWWRLRFRQHIASATLDVHGAVPDAVIEEFGWKRRSVVVMAIRDQAEIARFIPAFLGDADGGEIAGSVSTLDGDRFSSYRIGSGLYFVGALPWWQKIELLLQENPWAEIAGVTVSCFFLAILLRAMLRQHARSRLQAVNDAERTRVA